MYIFVFGYAVSFSGQINVLCLMSYAYIQGGELDFAQIYRNINQHGIELLSTLLHEVAHALTYKG